MARWELLWPAPARLVKLGALERMLMSWALWELVDGDYVTVQTLPGVQIDGWDDTPPRLLMVPGSNTLVELSLAVSVAAVIPPEGCDARRVVERWVAERSPLPVFGVLRAVRPELMDAGLLHGGVRPPRPWRRVALNLVMSGAEGYCERIAALAPRFDRLWADWLSFQREPDSRDLANSFADAAKNGLVRLALEGDGGG